MASRATSSIGPQPLGSVTSRNLISRRLRGGRTQIDSYDALATDVQPNVITMQNGGDAHISAELSGYSLQRPRGRAVVTV
jgi:hypothetical protein